MVIAAAEFSKEEDKAKEKKKYEIMLENMEEAKKNAETAEKESIMATSLKAVKEASTKADTEAGKVIVRKFFVLFTFVAFYGGIFLSSLQIILSTCQKNITTASYGNV